MTQILYENEYDIKEFGLKEDIIGFVRERIGTVIELKRKDTANQDIQSALMKEGNVSMRSSGDHEAETNCDIQMASVKQTNGIKQETDKSIFDDEDIDTILEQMSNPIASDTIHSASSVDLEHDSSVSDTDSGADFSTKM